MNYGHKKVVRDNMELAEQNLREVLMQNGFGRQPWRKRHVYNR